MNKDKQGGIGLDNVQKRLEIIYPGTYSLEIEQNDEEYQVHLMIQRL